jgi:hypothetical protein
LKANEGFVKTQTTDDVKIPSTLKIPSDLEEINNSIQKVVENGKLIELLPLVKKVL